jgi:hypothetical protein
VVGWSITPRTHSAALNAPSADELPPIREPPTVTNWNSRTSRSCSVRAAFQSPRAAEANSRA